MPGSQQTPPFQALNQRRTFEQIISQVEQAIIEGRLQPGDRLPSERQLAETFAVSRASVREALRVLEMFGVVNARRGKGPDSGSVVAAGASTGLLSVLSLHAGLLRIPTADIVTLRAVLEGWAAELATKNISAEELARLRELVGEMGEADSIDTYNVVDTEFHVELARGSGNALLPVLMEALRGVVRQAMIAAHVRLEDGATIRSRLVVEHEHIVELLEGDDPAAAAAAVRGHILGFYYNDVVEQDPGSGSVAGVAGDPL